ncbi:MAG: CinA family nicotinamide mononucleotide deamidase-related protein [Anaerolineae bacterium]|nr:CinA family nicotinamide mononucleotide deamidase-related protein [Anaerolineae bacterium]
MAHDINAEIISIGTEILLGEITDTNSVHIARSLRDIGVNVYFMTSVGDNEGRITAAIREAMARAQVVITTGGLGPTVDDMTRQAVATATDRPLVFHQDLLDKIAERFVGFKVTMTTNNRRQAFLPEGALLIENPVGTAPCFVVEHEGHLVISLPGVPREMKFLLAERVIPYLQERYQLGVIKARILRTAGIGESSLDDLIGEELLQGGNPTVGLAAHSGVVDIRITAKAANLEAAEQMIAVTEEQIRNRAGEYIFGTDAEQIEEALTDLLYATGGKLAVSETGIQGAVSERLRKTPHFTDVVAQTNTYDNLSLLTDALGITAQADLRELAQQAAARISQESGATIGIAIVSDPDRAKDEADIDVGTAVAVCKDGQFSSRVYGFGAQAAEAKLWTSTWAMARAWQMMQSK